MQQREDLVVGRAEGDLRDRFTQQFARFKRAEVVTPAVSDGGDHAVQLDNVGQEPAAIVPGWQCVAEARQAMFLCDECAQVT